MNKLELAAEAAKKCALSNTESKALMDATFDILSGILGKQDSLTIQNFGTFSVQQRQSHRFFNPFRSVMMLSPTKLAATFHPSKSYNERVTQRLKP